MLLNTIIILITYTLTTCSLWIPVLKGQSPQVAPTRKNLLKIAFKLLLLHAALWLLCWQCNIDAFQVILIIGCIALFTFCFFELAAPVLVVGYVLLQWILGFPDKKLWLPPNKRYKQKTNIPDNLIGKTATTQTPLRPTGYIQVDDKEYLAKSEINFIDKNMTVEITAITNGTILVNTSK